MYGNHFSPLGSPQLRYSHEASGRIRGFLPLKDACCCSVSSEDRHVSFFSVASSARAPFLLCSVDQQLTVLGDPGFRLQDDCKKVTFPNGPTTLLANQIVGDPSASDSHCEGSYWTFEMSGNSAWACGLVISILYIYIYIYIFFFVFPLNFFFQNKNIYNNFFPFWKKNKYSRN